jgi:ribonuclease HII
MIIGVDECGLGSWAGPLCVCGVRVDESWMHQGLNDSKKLTPKRRAVLYEELKAEGVRYEICWKEVEEIDQDGVYAALHAAWKNVILKLLEDAPSKKVRIIVDGDTKVRGLKVAHECIVDADSLIPAVMAASIIGKHTRDGLMIRMAEKYPGYKFENNKGYGTPQHREGLEANGVCEIHRRSYRPIQKIIEDGPQGNGIGYYPVSMDLYEGWRFNF